MARRMRGGAPTLPLPESQSHSDHQLAGLLALPPRRNSNNTVPLPARATRILNIAPHTLPFRYRQRTLLKRISRRCCDGMSSAASAYSRPTALLVLLPASTRTRIVPSHLVSAYHLLYRSGSSSSSHSRLVQLTTLAALELRLHVIHRRHGTRSPRSQS